MHIRLRKILGLVFVLTAAIAAAGLLAGCGQAAYTAVFMADGEVVATVDCTDGVPVDTVPVPEKPGYTGAWGTAAWDGDRLVVTAAYTPNAYYITFKAYGDMTVDVVAYTTGDAAVEEPEVPVMYGYEGSWEPYSLAAGGNLTVRAVYTAIEYTVTYIADGQTIAVVTASAENPPAEPEVPEKSGYTGRWETSATDGYDYTMTAVYTPIHYCVVFTDDDRWRDFVYYTVEDTEIVEPEVPYKYGYEGSWEPYTLTYGDTVTVRAVYTPIEYSVTFVADGSTVQVVYYTVEDTEIAEPAVPAKTGYTGRWENYATNCANITVNAIYTPIRYYVTFVADGSTVRTESYTVEDTDISEPTVPGKYGYEGSWEPYTLTYGDVTVHAVYTRTLFSVTLQADGETGRLSGGGEHIRGETVTVTAEPYGGYAFSGWYDGETLVSEEASYTFTMPERDVTYAARFAVRADMAPFTFTADARFCTVTGVTDPTVTQLVVPDCVTNIAFNALGSCTSLKSLTVPASGSLGSWFGASQPDYNAAYVPATLTEVTVTGGTSISGFRNCIFLERVTLPDTLTRIGERAFSGCENLTEITIPSEVTEIGNYAFEGCKSLRKIAIPSGVTNIGFGVFIDCIALTEVTLPSGVAQIETYAFGNCESLTKITLPSDLTVIEDSAFSGCESLTEIAIPSGIRVLEESVFSGCTALRRIDLPSGLYSIGSSAFSGCESLTEVTIPSGVTSIEYRAFYNCSSLTEIEIPAGVTEIGNHTFFGCTSLTEIEIPSGVTKIGNDVFSGCSSLTEIAIPTGIRVLEESVFSGCTALRRIDLPSGLTSIGEFAFSDCESLTEVTIPSGVTEIGGYAFEGCTALETVTLPSGLTSIGEMAFRYCSSLTEVTIPSGVTEIGQPGFIGQQAFDGCERLMRIDIPAGVTEIGSSAFNGCTALTEITLPSGLTSIGEFAFRYCSSLTEVTIPSGVTEIGGYAFDGCTALATVTLPFGLASIGEHAFFDCRSLTEIAIPVSVTEIGDRVFDHLGGSSLTAVWYGGDEAAWADVSVGTNNQLTGKVYFYSPDPPVAEGNYWHYADDGVTPVAW